MERKKIIPSKERKAVFAALSKAKNGLTRTELLDQTQSLKITSDQFSKLMSNLKRDGYIHSLKPEGFTEFVFYIEQKGIDCLNGKLFHGEAGTFTEQRKKAKTKKTAAKKSAAKKVVKKETPQMNIDASVDEFLNNASAMVQQNAIYRDLLLSIYNQIGNALDIKE